MSYRFSAILAFSLITMLPAAGAEASSKPGETDAAASSDLPMTAAPGGSVTGDLGRPADLLERMRDANTQVYSALKSFVCNEHITRFKGRLDGSSARQIDTVTAKVSFENGIEQYIDIRQNNRERASISSLQGAWSEGEFGTLLQQTQALLNHGSVVFGGYTTLAGTPAAIYGIDVQQEDSPWDLTVGANHYRVAFHTDAWISARTGQILRIERRSKDLPEKMGISEIRWSVNLENVDMNGRTWLLPVSGEYLVTYDELGRREWNEMTFSDYRRYGSEVALRFQ